MNKISKQKLVMVVVLLLVVVALVLAGYFYMKSRKLEQNPQVVAQREADDVIAKISKLIVLPTNETPTVATVSDPTALKDQPFFASAQKGDKVLVYAQAKKAVLYSVSLNKIIDVTLLSTGTPKAETPGATTPETKTTSIEKKS